MTTTLEESALLIGASAGMRTCMPLTGLSLSHNASLQSFSRVARQGILAAACFEFLMDKLPISSRRTHPVQLVPRALTAGLVSGLLAKSQSRPPLPYALLGAATAVGAAFLFYEIRKQLTHSAHIPDTLVALGEDALAMKLALSGTR